MFARVPIAQTQLLPLDSIAAFQPLRSRQETLTVVSENFGDLVRIYEDSVNLCVIERPRPNAIELFVQSALQAKTRLEISQVADPQSYDFAELWPQAANLAGYDAWTADVAWLTAAYCELFGLREAGLRIRTLDKAMCPRFHVDRVTARLVCSYGGIGTEWLPAYALDRSKLGMGACGQRRALRIDPGSDRSPTNAGLRGRPDEGRTLGRQRRPRFGAPLAGPDRGAAAPLVADVGYVVMRRIAYFLASDSSETFNLVLVRGAYPTDWWCKTAS